MENLDNNKIAIIIAILSFLSTIASVIRQIVKDRATSNKEAAEGIKAKAEAEKAQAEADDISVSTALSLITPLKQRVTDLETEILGVGEKIVLLEALLKEKDNRIIQLEKRERELNDENTTMKKQIKNLQAQLKQIKDKYHGCDDFPEVDT